MANIGLRNARYNLIDKAVKNYKALPNNKVPVLGRMIDAKCPEERAEASLFADDGLAEYDSSFTGAKLNVTLDNVDDPTYATIKGCEISEDEEVTENQDDQAPEMGYGHVITKMVNGVKKYKVEFLPRIKVTSVTADAKTKGESIEFGTVSIEGKVMALLEPMNGLKAGTWRKFKTFNTLEEAQKYLDTFLTPKDNVAAENIEPQSNVAQQSENVQGSKTTK